VIFARARFGVASDEIEGEIFVFFEMGSLESLVAGLDRSIESAAEPC
jgi:hypothetical protein